MFSRTFAALLVTALALSAQGKLEINGQNFPITNVYACMCPDTFDSKKTVLQILAVDRELAPHVRTDADAVRDLVWNKQLNGIAFQIDGNSIFWNLRSSVAGSISVTRSPNPFKLTITPTRVKGQLKLAEPDSVGDTKYYFEFPIDAAIEKPAAEPAPTPADRAAAAKSPAAQAYLAFQKVLMTGTVSQIADLVDPEKGEMMRKEPKANEMLAFIRQMQAKNIAVLKATESADEATLITSGVTDGKPQSGKITMKKMAGKWIVMKESWKGSM